MPNVQVGESEAQDVATGLAPYLEFASSKRTYVIASNGGHYIQFHASRAPRLFGEIVSTRYLRRRGLAWQDRQLREIAALGFNLGPRNHERTFDEPRANGDAADAAEAFFLRIARKPSQAIIEYWMSSTDSNLGPLEVGVRLANDAERHMVTPPSQRKPVLVSYVRTSALPARYNTGESASPARRPRPGRSLE
jgi:hypothetical protein